ncbi:hypothetical protein M422DRAFT_218058 [Sphaerobolus stellatus SS14]|nr:hypothetical protein M422DRAFT_218058 [Sphaerobolus stellatus SS14]
MSLSDSIARASLALYTSLKFRPANPLQYTILSTFTLVRRDGSTAIKPISLGTGVKCLPESRLGTIGDTVHDSHAEILARRGFIRWLLSELCNSSSSEWIEPKSSGRWGLKKDVSLHMYISTLPCGDASMRALAAAPQNPQMAALKESTPVAVPTPNIATRGRDNYHLLGVLRTKPGRADSPPTLSMSCSDKIARWCVLGVQGALASNLFEPIYLEQIIIGGVPEGLKEVVKEDCERAFRSRLDSPVLADLPSPYSLHTPRITFTQEEFPHGKVQLTSDTPPTTCNECLSYISESGMNYEVLINGLRRGVGDRQRLKSRLRPFISKIALFTLYRDVLNHLSLSPLMPSTTYHEAKQAATDYKKAKAILLGPKGPFAGWIVSGKTWESFTVDEMFKPPE